MKKTIYAAALAAPLAIGAETGGSFEATSVAHTGTVRVSAPPEQAFQLFTAPGERLWVSGWDPVVLSGGDGREKGSVFVTTHHEEKTIWVVVDYQPESLRARYARVAPASRAGTVEVVARSDGMGGSRIDVTYELTALSQSGNGDLDSFDDEQFAQMLSDWENAIRNANIELPVRFDR